MGTTVIFQTLGVSRNLVIVQFVLRIGDVYATVHVSIENEPLRRHRSRSKTELACVECRRIIPRETDRFTYNVIKRRRVGNGTNKEKMLSSKL